MQLNNETSKSDLENKVRSTVTHTLTPAPNGGPLGEESDDEYKNRLFDWLVGIAQRNPKQFHLLIYRRMLYKTI